MTRLYGILLVLLTAVSSQAQWNTHVVSDAGTVGSSANKVVVDGSGQPHIFYEDRTARRAVYSVWNGTMWRTHEPLETYSIAYVSGDLAPDGTPHICSHSDANTLRHAKRIGGTWVRDTVGSLSYGAVNLRVDNAGTPHIITQNPVRHYWQAGTWQNEVLLSSVTSSSSTVDGDGRICVAFYQNQNLYALAIDSPVPYQGAYNRFYGSGWYGMSALFTPNSNPAQIWNPAGWATSNQLLIPEPATLALLGLGLAGIAAYRKKRLVTS